MFQHFQQVAEKVKEAAKEAKDKTEREAAGQGVHWGVYCDQSGTHPIVGPRWHKCGENFDLCNAEFMKLPEEERSLFERIERPGDAPTPYIAEGDAEFPAAPVAPADDTMVGEPAQQNATETDSPAVSIGDAMSQLGLGEDAMSASILLDLQGALNDNAAQAEAQAIEESAAELAAAAEAEAKAAAEAAEAKAAAEAAEAKAKAAAEAAEAKAAAEAADVMVHPLIEQI